MSASWIFPNDSTTSWTKTSTGEPEEKCREQVSINYLFFGVFYAHIISKFTFSLNRKVFSVSALLESCEQQRTILYHALCSALVDIRTRSMNLKLLIFYYLIRVFRFLCLLARALVWNDACVVMSQRCLKTLCKIAQRSKGRILYNTFINHS